MAIRTKKIKLPPEIMDAIVSGPVPVVREWRDLDVEKEMSRAERMMAFMENYLTVPEGPHVGEPLDLALFQEVFIRAIYDNPVPTSLAILSVARRNGKSALTSGLLAGKLLGPERAENEVLASAANSRDQSALIFRLMRLMIEKNPEIAPLSHTVASQKRIVAKATGSEFLSMAADARTGHGRGLAMIVLDEAGQISAESNDFVQMLQTSQGSVIDPLFVIISTQAPSDASYLSRVIDDAMRADDPSIVCHLYAADAECDVEDQKQWLKANPGLDIFRSRADLKKQLARAKRLPSEEARARNLLLNQRVALERLWLAPTPWKECNGAPDMEALQDSAVSMGLDLSSRRDLTAAVIAASDSAGVVSLYPFVFTPSEGIEERSEKDRADYAAWVRDGFMFTAGHRSIDYDAMFEILDEEFTRLGVRVDTIEYDRWKIDDAQAAADRMGVFTDVEWNPVGQGYRDFGPRCDTFEDLLVNGKLRHGSHPLLNMAASNAIAVPDPTGAVKLDKVKSTQRIDPIIAAVMAAYRVSEGQLDGFDVGAMIA